MAKRKKPVKRITISPAKVNRFLAHMAKTGRLHQSADAANISVQQIRTWRKDLPDFEERYVSAELAYCETIESEIERRGKDGWDEPVFQGGVEVGKKRRYSDALLLAHAKSRMSKYRDKIEAEVKHSGQVLAVPLMAQSEEDFDKIVREQSGEDTTGKGN